MQTPAFNLFISGGVSCYSWSRACAEAKGINQSYGGYVQLTMKIFDTVISPILTYGSEVWGVDHDGKLENDPIEFVQTKFIRWLLGVNKFCSSNACRSEVGRFPMRTKTKCRAIKYWLKFCEPEHQNKLSGIAFTDQIGQDKKELWSSKLKRLLNLAGLGDIWSAKTNTPAIMNYIRQRLLDIEQQTWISKIHNDERKDPHQKNKQELLGNLNLLMTTKITSQM